VIGVSEDKLILVPECTKKELKRVECPAFDWKALPRLNPGMGSHNAKGV